MMDLLKQYFRVKVKKKKKYSGRMKHAEIH